MTRRYWPAADRHIPGLRFQRSLALLMPPLMVIAASVGFLRTQEFWEDTPWQQWTRTEAMEMLHQSPWTRRLMPFPRNSVSAASPDPPVPRRLSAGPLSARVALYSARPVRLAGYRTVQIDHGYDKLSDSDKATWDKENQHLLVPDPGRLLVAFMQTRNLGNNQFTFDGLSAQEYAAWQRIPEEHLIERVRLVTTRFKAVHPESFRLPPSPGGFGPIFVFPRVIDGIPIVSPNDTEFRFVVDLGRAVAGSASWDPRDLLFKGELSF